MLGWHISVHRLAEPNPLGDFADATALSEAFSRPSERETLIARLVPGDRIAVWHTYTRGLDWINRLVAEQQALAIPYIQTDRRESVESRSRIDRRKLVESLATRSQGRYIP
jgi:hypothetical protein